MKDIKAISFCFENCETVTIPIKYIMSFNIGEITESINMSSRANGVWNSRTAGSLYIRFSPEFNTATDVTTTCGENAYTRLQRYNDICYITIVEQDENERTFGIRWPHSEEDYTWNNPRQTNSVRFNQLEIEVTP